MFTLDNYTFRNDTPASTICEIRDYIYMANNNLPLRMAWEAVKHSWVTTDVTTIWQITEAYYIGRPESDAIGHHGRPPVSLMEEILQRVIKA